MFACGVHSARNGCLRRLVVRWKLKNFRRRKFSGAGATPTVAAGAVAADAPGTQTEPQLEAATSAGIILPETGQFLLLYSLQLWGCI